MLRTMSAGLCDAIAIDQPSDKASPRPTPGAIVRASNPPRRRPASLRSSTMDTDQAASVVSVFTATR